MSTRIVDVEAPGAGYRLQVERRDDGEHCDATLFGPDGKLVYQCLYWPDAVEAIGSAADHLVHGMTPALPHVASALRVSALAELKE